MPLSHGLVISALALNVLIIKLNLAPTHSIYEYHGSKRAVADDEMSCNCHKYSAHSPSGNPYSHHHSYHIPHSLNITTVASHSLKSPRLLPVPFYSTERHTQCLLNTTITVLRSLNTLLARAHPRIALYPKSPNRVTLTLSNTFNFAAPRNDTTPSRFCCLRLQLCSWVFRSQDDSTTPAIFFPRIHCENGGKPIQTLQ